MTQYNYNVTDTLYNTLNESALDAELRADPTLAALPEEMHGVVRLNGTFDVYWSAPISGAGEAAMDAVVAAHTGAAVQRYSCLAHLAVVPGSHTVTQDASWEVCGGVCDRVEDYGSDPTLITERIMFSYKATEGAGSEQPILRFVETLGDGTTPIAITQEISLPDTGGAWVTTEVTTTVARRPGLNQYALEARLAGAVSLDVRFAALWVCRS